MLREFAQDIREGASPHGGEIRVRQRLLYRIAEPSSATHPLAGGIGVEVRESLSIDA
ncbi:hypothetical protein GCM10010341_72790 [Streptomyces noursei]|nr:hypothetical protein GCM10010341_72790 [Streptomyces noursei]